MTSFHMGGARRLSLVGEREKRGVRQKCIDRLRSNATRVDTCILQNRDSGKIQHA